MDNICTIMTFLRLYGRIYSRWCYACVTSVEIYIHDAMILLLLRTVECGYGEFIIWCNFFFSFFFYFLFPFFSFFLSLFSFFPFYFFPFFSPFSFPIFFLFSFFPFCPFPFYYCFPFFPLFTFYL